MKKTYKLITLLCLLTTLFTAKLSAQCINSFLFATETITSTVPGNSVQVTTCNWAGDYNDITFNVTGTFIFTSSLAGDYFTITDGSSNVLIAGVAPLSVTIPSLGVYQMHITNSGPPTCGQDNTCRTTEINVPLPPCAGMPSAGTIPPSFSICPNESAVIPDIGYTNASGITYQWMQAPAASGPWTNVTTGSGFNTPVLTTASLTTLTFYQMVITCTISSQSATTAITSVNPNNPVSLCYCATGLGGGGCFGNHISNVSILSTPLNNNSGCSNTASFDSYTQYSPAASTTATLNAASSYSMSVETTANNNIAFWIDYDHNGMFDAYEFYQVTTNSTPNTPTVLFFNVPSTALGGITGMRVRSHDSFATVTNTDACSNFYEGETEDYIVNIVPAPVCSGVPNPGSITATPTLVCSGTNVNMNLTGYSANSGLTFQWQQSSNISGPWTAVSGATFTALSQIITTPVFYRVVVACGSNTAATVAFQYSVQPVNLCYCATGLGGGGCFGNHISNVSILSTPLNNTSGCSNTASFDSYSQYLPSATTTATLTAPNAYSISIETTANNNVAFWIDYDHNGMFDSYEFYQVTTSSTPSVATVLVFNLPSTALGGQTGLRVRSHDSFATVTNTDACSNFYEGETEDYIINIIPAPGCSGTPNPGSITATPTLVCSGENVNMTLTGFSPVSGLTFQWQQSPNVSGPWTSVPGATFTALSQNITSTVFYHVIVACATNTAATAAFQFSLQPSILCYCNQNLGGSGCFGDEINNITIFNTPLNNNSTCNSTATNGTYSQFLPGPTTTATLNIGSTYTIALYTTADNIESVWFDYDHSGTFDVSEHTQIALTTIPNSTTTATFTVPVTALLGQTGMRVRSRATGNPNGPPDACLSFGSGEAEDYIVTIACAVPNLTLTASSTTICNGTPVNLTGSGATTYSWNTSAVTSSITVTPSVSTTYTLTGNNGPGCSTTKTINIVVLLCTGIEKNTIINGTTFIYPNPNNGNINVVIENTGNHLFEIFDLTGRVVYKINLSQAQTSLSIKDLANGMYTYKITSSSSKVAIKEGKLIKE